MKKFKVYALIAVCVTVAVSAVYAGNSYKIYMNGVVISDHVVIMHDEPYVPLADLTRALNLQVSKTDDGWNLSQGSAASGQEENTQGQTMPASAPQDTLPLTNIPAKAEHGANNLVVVNNEKANVINTPETLWLPLNNPAVQNLRNDWTPPMDINGVTYGNGYMFLFYNGDQETLTYWLKGRHYTTLTATLGLDDHVEGNTGNMLKVSFWGNGRLLKSVLVGASDNPVNVSVPVSGILTLKINVAVTLNGQGAGYPTLDMVNPTLSR